MEQSAIFRNVIKICPIVFTEGVYSETPTENYIKSVLDSKYTGLLKFWEDICNLRDNQRQEIYERYMDVSEGKRVIVEDLAWEAAAEKIGDDLANVCYVATFNAMRWSVFGIASWELIGDVEKKVVYGIISSHKGF